MLSTEFDYLMILYKICKANSSDYKKINFQYTYHNATFAISKYKYSY